MKQTFVQESFVNLQLIKNDEFLIHIGIFFFKLTQNTLIQEEGNIIVN